MNESTALTGKTSPEITPAISALEAAPPANLDLLYLQAQLARIDVLIRQHVERWQIAGQDPMDAFRGLYISDSEARSLAHRPIAHAWGHLVSLPAQRAEQYNLEFQRAQAEIDQVAARFVGLNLLSRLDYLAAVFGLDRFDLDTLLICLAPSLDLRYERLFGYLQDDVSKKRPTVNLVLDLLCLPGSEHIQMMARFNNDSALFKFHILEKSPSVELANDVLLARTLRVNESIVSWLLGQYQPHPELGHAAQLFIPQVNSTDILLAEKALFNSPLFKRLAGQATASETPAPAPLVVFYGADETSQHAAARLLSAQLSRMLLMVDLEAAVAGGLTPARAVWLGLRDARLTGAIPFFIHWDACLPKEGAHMPSPEVLIELLQFTDLVIVSGVSYWRPADLDRQRRMLWQEFPVPGYLQRLAIWKHFLADDLESDLLIPVAGQFKLEPNQIRDAVAAARDKSVQDGTSIDQGHIFAAARAYSNPNLSSLARKINPRFHWSDIILPADQIAQLTEIVTMVRGRPLVLEEWGVGRKLTSSQGITILFAGPPGTGKTMAAEVLARELSLDLYKIDLSTVVSKYIGETEKNLEKIFYEAASSNAILFFDEADAIFGKRSEVKDAHDRYANIEISYLLQRMEAYDGVTILATNLRANLDEAFTRRLQFAIDFPFPEENDRLRIWNTLFPPDVPCDPELDFPFLARRFKLAGGSIRNIIVTAAYLAAADQGVVKMEHMLHGARREMQKMGRLVDE